MDVDPFLTLSLTHSRLSLFLAFIFNMRLVAKNAIESFFAFLLAVYLIRVLLYFFLYAVSVFATITTDSRQ